MLAKALSAATAAAVEKLYVEDVFSTWLYTEASSRQTITNGIDLSGKGGLVWLKARGSAFPHALYDTARGARRRLVTDSTSAQSADLNPYGVEFSSTGFTTDQGDNGVTYTSWTFRKAKKFFDAVTYTGNGSNRTIAHNLGSVPGCIIVKRTDTTGDWQVYHRSLANTEYLVLNSTAAKETGTTHWNSTTPTSTEFSLGTDATVNANAGTYVAYLFAHDAGGFGDSGNESVVSCGGYTGNGSTSGPTITLGWEPQWLLVKRTDNANSWWMLDTMRGLPVGSGAAYLLANLSSAEASFGNDLLALSATGFRLITDNSNFNANGGSYIYIAIRRGPMKTPTDATKVFSASLRTGTGSVTNVTTLAFPTDLLLTKARTEAWYALDFRDRLRGSTKRLNPSSTSAEDTPTATVTEFLQNGYSLPSDANGYVNYSSRSYIDLNFRRAPGFFDVVAYTGTGSTRTVAHNLGVVPEFLVVKSRSTGGSTYGWFTYVPAIHSVNQYLELQRDIQTISSSGIWNTGVTSTTFGLGSDSVTNGSGTTFIAYLFASCPGVSKVGSYTGTGTTLQINCGFTSSARFVLIKRTDSTGDWYVWDTARGIISGNDSYLLLNSTAAEVTNTDYIDPYSAGFEISSTAPAAINANGGSFIYLAVA